MSATLHDPLVGLPAQGAVMAQARTENFPVAARILGARTRTHLLAIYGFARLVDDTGDEASGSRAVLLDAIDEQLSDIYNGRTPAHPILRDLRTAIAQCRLPEEPFRRLLEANRLDQVKHRYQSYEELLDYCRLSAAPVGELVLHVFGAATPERIELSGRICAALQVIEHLQDVREDYLRGRVYLPLQDLAQFGCEEAQLAERSAAPQLRAVVQELSRRSAELLDAGMPLVAGLHGRARVAVAAYVAGGRATLAALRGAGYDVLAHRPRRTRAGFATAFVRAIGGRA